MIAPANEHTPLSGQRILVVEDNYLVASALQQHLEELGCTVVGPVPSLDEGMAMVEDENLTGAILDINIIGGTSAPIAHALRDRGCPFFFITGYTSPRLLPDSLTDCRRLMKPIDETVLERTIHQELTTAGSQ